MKKADNKLCLIFSAVYFALLILSLIFAYIFTDGWDFVGVLILVIFSLPIYACVLGILNYFVNAKRLRHEESSPVNSFEKRLNIALAALSVSAIICVICAISAELLGRSEAINLLGDVLMYLFLSFVLIGIVIMLNRPTARLVIWLSGGAVSMGTGSILLFRRIMLWIGIAVSAVPILISFLMTVKII